MKQPVVLTPRDWQIEATSRAAKLVGTPEGELALVEARRYGALADESERMRTALVELGGMLEIGPRAMTAIRKGLGMTS